MKALFPRFVKLNKEFIITFSIFNLLLIFSFRDLLINPNLIPSQHDLRNTFWPIYQFIQNNLYNHHSFPLWYPVELGGTSLYGSYSYGLGFPLYWLYFIMPVSLAFTYVIYISLLLTGIASFFLAKNIFKLNSLTSYFFAVSLMLSPKYFAHIYAGHISVIASLPFIITTIYFFINLFNHPSFKSSFLLALSVTLLYLTGGTQIPFFTLVILALFSLLHLIFEFISWLPKQNLKSTKYLNITIKKILKEKLKFYYLLLAVLFTFGLSMFQLIPTLEQASTSNRSHLNYWETAIPALYPDTLIQSIDFFPKILPNHETIFNFGLLPLIFFFVGIFSKGKFKWVLISLSIFTLLFSFGSNLPIKIQKIFYLYIPGFSMFRVPARMIFYFIPLVLLIAAFGFEKLLNLKSLRNYKRLTAIGLLILSTLQLIIYNFNFIKPALSPNNDPNILETATFLSSLNNTIPPERFYFTHKNLPENSVYLSGSHNSGGGEDLISQDYLKFIKLAGNYNYDLYSPAVPPDPIGVKESPFYQTPTPNPSLLGLLNVKTVFSPYFLEDPNLDYRAKYNDLYYYENKKVLPRAYLAFDSKVSSSIEDLKNLDTTQTILIPKTAKEATSDARIKEVRIENYSPNSITLYPRSDKSSYLVLSENYHPNWSVYVDGNKKEVTKVDFILRGVFLESGNHKVEFRYEPQNFFIYTMTTIITLSLGIYLSFPVLSKSPAKLAHLKKPRRKSNNF